MQEFDSKDDATLLEKKNGLKVKMAIKLKGKDFISITAVKLTTQNMKNIKTIRSQLSTVIFKILEQ